MRLLLCGLTTQCIMPNHRAEVGMAYGAFPHAGDRPEVAGEDAQSTKVAEYCCLSPGKFKNYTNNEAAPQLVASGSEAGVLLLTAQVCAAAAAVSITVLMSANLVGFVIGLEGAVKEYPHTIRSKQCAAV